LFDSGRCSSDSKGKAEEAEHKELSEDVKKETKEKISLAPKQLPCFTKEANNIL